MIYHLIRTDWRVKNRQRRTELVAVVVDPEMAWTWVRNCPPTEYRRCHVVFP